MPSSIICSTRSPGTDGPHRANARGLEVDAHHTVEDTSLAFRTGTARGAGDKAGVTLYGNAMIPLDEALTLCVVDLSGRPYLVHEEPELVELIGTYETITDPAHLRIHRRDCGTSPCTKVQSGRNAHHIVESQFKAFARALRQAVAPDPGSPASLDQGHLLGS